MKHIKTIFLINFILVLAVINFSIFSKEKVLKDGKLVLLELAPLDPRSLMQGDYMRLRYKETGNLFSDDIPSRGFAVLKLDENGIGKLLRHQKESGPFGESELGVKYFYYNDFVTIGAESYFFQEGHAEAFEKAKYGGLRVSDNGESVLIGLYNEGLQLIKPD